MEAVIQSMVMSFDFIRVLNFSSQNFQSLIRIHNLYSIS